LIKISPFFTRFQGLLVKKNSTLSPAQAVPKNTHKSLEERWLNFEEKRARLGASI